MKIAGLDLSMSCPAITIFDCDKPLCLSNLEFHYLIGTKKQIVTKYEPYFTEGKSIPTDYNSNEERWDFIGEWVYNCVKDCECINLESQSYGSIGSMLCQISEMHGVVKHILYKNNIKIVLTPPSQNKKKFSGKGNATKLEMIAAFDSKYNCNIMQDYNIIGNNLHPVEDIVDSVALMEGLKEELNA
jgi:Holliday junction resolvasome RuvABC endonuclease subunit